MGLHLQLSYPVFCGVFLGSFGFAYLVCAELRAFHAYGALTRAQITSGIFLSVIFALCCATEATIRALGLDEATASEILAPLKKATSTPPAGSAGEALEAGGAGGNYGSTLSEGSPSPLEAQHRTAVAMLLTLQKPLRAGAELAGILAFMFLCDRTHLFQEAPKYENVAVFWGLWALICVAAAFTVRELKQAKPLQREQTDEWRGWMQLMFLMYHYFHYENIYNAIRVYIAGYVMMTGFGNFIYYRKTDDFSPRRIMQMLFRLNFLGFCVCIALNNELMLYYICPMHTFFTVLVILALFVGRRYNQSTSGVWLKVLVIAAITVLVYDGPSFIFNGLFDTVPYWKRMFVFHDPLHPEFEDEMHEWHFRSGLDRFNWVFGMLVAMHLPQLGDMLEKIDSLESPSKHAARGGLAFVVLVLGAFWVHQVFLLDKYDYNKVHPFTSIIPLVLFIILRNITPTLRQHYLYAFAWIGQYTLETYILQFHVWMRTTGINGSPKSLIAFIPGFFYANFIVGTAIYIFLSIRFFKLTGVLRDALIPGGEDQLRPIATVLVAGCACWMLAGTHSFSAPH
eukprot:TRINITY_DN295_c0_g1_i1.p1 TRINITY_DN295_c0_g1~~TRINITY_DN295_c0_g1_i1.p1  ORF type:complete len:568 (-),score=115.60 TRINITY_DN295_c0_g1_i1:22-1725(-)